MIEQKATVINRDEHQVWVQAERQSTCGQCQARKGCGTGMLAKHVGKRFSTLSVATDESVEIGQEVTVAIPEQALLSGAFMMYILPLLLLFVAAALVRMAGGGELFELMAGMTGLIAGFYFVKQRLRHKKTEIKVTTEDSK